MLLAIIFGVVLYVINTTYFCLYISFIAFIVIVLLIQDFAETRNIVSADIIDRFIETKERFRTSGFSIGSRGGTRFYWRAKNEPVCAKLVFNVTYENGRTKKVTAIEGSKKCKTILKYVGFWKKDSKDVDNAPSQVASTQIENAPPAINLIKDEQIAEGKYYLEIPFDVLTNELSLSVLYPSCKLEVTSYRKTLNLQFEVKYNGEFKGVRNRAVVCAILDRRNRIIDIKRDRHSLDVSGSKIIDINFFDIHETPCRVRVGVERIN